MNVFELTRELVDIESLTNNELAVGLYLDERLRALATRYAGRVERFRRKYAKSDAATAAK